MTNFRDKVESVVRSIPSGQVFSYLEVAALAGNPRAARAVGRIARTGDVDTPWHRVIRADGTLAPGFAWGGEAAQRQMLEAEGVVFDKAGVVKDKEQRQ